MITEHTQRFGKAKMTVGYSKAMLEEALHYDEVVHRRSELDKKKAKDEGEAKDQKIV